MTFPHLKRVYLSVQGLANALIASACFTYVRSARRALKPVLLSDHGTSLVETALVLPIILSITFGLLQFSILFINDIGLTNGVQSAAHFAATSPRAWTNSNPTTDTSTIEGWIQPVTSSLPNDDTHIVISYLDGASGVPCGSYSQATNSFVPVGSATLNTCVVKNNLIKVQAIYTFTFVSFPLQTVFTQGVGLRPSAVILEEN